MKKIIPYLTLIFFLAVISTIARTFLQYNRDLTTEIDFQLFVFGSILFVGYTINRIAPRTIIPSFVWAIFAGMALQPLLYFYTHEIEGFKIVMEVLAAYILFAGGIEVPVKSFKKWFFPIASLSLIGVIFSAILFSAVLFVLLLMGGVDTSTLIPSILIISAALASTDPTAIIPTLKTMKFKRGFLKQIAISESALTDVSGSILTRFLLVALLTVPFAQSNTVLTYISPLLQKATYDALALQIISGIIVGYLGYVLLKHFYVTKSQPNQHDPALLLAIPLFTFVLGNILGGAGFLAAFVSGLLTERESALNNVSHFYASILDHLAKPFIFISLGALVPIAILIQNAPLGIIAGLVFIFLIRPFVVFISLFPWLINRTFQMKDLLFLSLIRETGIIAAVLIVIASSYHIIDSQFVISLGMWVILLTLIIEPPITPYLSKKIGVVK